MSTIRLLVLASDGNWSGIVPAGLAKRAFAALSADPTSHEDLQSAIRRFIHYPPAIAPLSELVPGDWDTPHDLGIIILDLVARLVVADTRLGYLSRSGDLFWQRYDETGHWETTDIGLPYELAEDWLISDQLNTWRTLSATRRDSSGLARFDFREILYGRPLYEYIAMRIWDAHREASDVGIFEMAQKRLAWGEEKAQLDDDDPPLDRFDFRGSNAEWAIIKRLHVDWLLTPRSDLREASPREIALAHQDRVSADLDDQASRWQLLNAEPPAISAQSIAYRYSSFGRHEWIQYYDLVRELLWNSWFHLTACCSESTAQPADGLLNSYQVDRAAYRQAEMARLAARAEEWLNSPTYFPQGRTPRSIIERERMRLPEIEQDHHKVFEPDCPVCEMMRLSPGPIFLSLDGCHFDDDFAFDHHCDSEEEWRDKQIDWQRFVQRVNQGD